MEMNANEKLYLSADVGISETFNSYPGHHRVTGGRNITHKKSESLSPNPKRSLQNKCQSQYSNSSVAISDIGAATVADAGMLRTVRARWRHDKRERAGSSSADDEKRSSPDQLQKKPVEDLPKTTTLSGESSGDGTVAPGQIKPRNCRRIVVLGAPKVGKTNIVRRFLGDGFDERYVPTTEDFHRKMYHVRGKPYLIDVLDASREREFPAKRRLSILTGKSENAPFCNEYQILLNKFGFYQKHLTFSHSETT